MFKLGIGRWNRNRKPHDDCGDARDDCDPPVDSCEPSCGPARILELPKIRFSGSECGPAHCEIPRPYWWPQLAGRVCSYMCPGGIAVVQLCVRNTGPSTRAFRVEIAPDEAAARAGADPQAFVLGPMEEKRVIVRYKVPADQPSGCGSTALIWVRGCLNHYIEWSVKTTAKVTQCCHEICVRDEPPYTLEWYHHFYCDHPCANHIRG